uniref:Uncharacterized protein n=1 Tax=Strongyloides papillosus TaxID=174720 RepID=A0A0N5C4K0_STREA
MSGNSGSNGNKPLNSQFPQYFTTNATEHYSKIEEIERNKQIFTQERTVHFQKMPVIQQDDKKTTEKINFIADSNREQETQHLKINNTVYHQLSGTQIITNESTKLDEKTKNRGNTYKTVFQYLAGSDQLQAKKNEFMLFVGNRFLEETLSLLKYSSNETLMQTFSKNHEKELYSFITTCYMSLIPERLRKKQGCLDAVINIFSSYFMISHFDFEKKRIINIAKCRKRKHKKKGLVSEHKKTQNEIDDAIIFLKKHTNSIFFNYELHLDIKILAVLRQRMEDIYSEFLEDNNLKAPELLPDLNRLPIILKTLFYYNEKIKNSTNVFNNEKLESSINEIFKRAMLRQPIEILSKINEKSNGIYVNIQDEKKTYVFAIGTTPIVLSENLEVTIKNWLMFNLLSPSFRMNEPHNRLYELLVTTTGGRGNHTTKGRAVNCIHVSQLINDIKDKNFETY